VSLLAIGITVSAILGILIGDLIHPPAIFLIGAGVASAVIGYLRKEVFYLAIFSLSALNYLILKGERRAGAFVEGVGDVIESRPYYQNYLIGVQSGSTLFEMVTKRSYSGDRVHFQGLIKRDEKSKVRVEVIRINRLGPSHPIHRFFIQLRERVLKTADSIKGEDERGLFIALLLGRCYYPKTDLWDFFARSGIIHLLTVSGLHVGFILSFGIFFLRILGMRRKGRIFALMLIPIYAGITGFRPPVVRASLMLGMIGIADLLERKVPTTHFLTLALLFLIIADPTAIFNPGAQLSFAAAGGIVLLYREFRGWLPQPKVLRYLALSILVSIAAQLATGPILIHYFGRVPTLAAISNLLVVPIAWVTVAVGIFTVLLGLILPSLLKVLTLPLSYLSSTIITVAKGFAAIPFSTLSIDWIPILPLPFYYISFIKRFRYYGLIGFLALATIFLFLPNERLSIADGKVRIGGVEIRDQRPIEIDLNGLKIRKVGEKVLIGGKMIYDGCYLITPKGMMRMAQGNIIRRLFDEMRFIYYNLSGAEVEPGRY